MKTTKYYIDMTYYKLYGQPYLDTVEQYLLNDVFSVLEEDEILDIFVSNWTVPINIGIYKAMLKKYIPGLIDRLRSGLTDDEKKTIFSPDQAIGRDEQKQD